MQVVAPPEDPAPPVEAATAPPAPETATPEPATSETAATEPVAEARTSSPTPDTAEPAPEPPPEPAGTDTPSLPGITLSFWQEQLERTLTAGQAILVCRSPEEAVRLQLAYMQATLASGFERAREVTRWSQAMVREVLPSRPR
jgi:hypothetical protein